MSDGGGMGVGIGAGMAIGVAMGVAVGKRKAKEEILRHLAGRAISLRDAGGNVIPIEPLLEEILATEAGGQRLPRALLVIGLIAVVAMALYFFFGR